MTYLYKTTQMGFKFLNTEQSPDQPEYITQERFNELVEHQLNNRPAVFLNLNRNRNTIDETEWTYLLRQQRVNLIEHMWEQGMISHTIVSQDINGFSLRTEINF
jgi:hypothetical protein